MRMLWATFYWPAQLVILGAASSGDVLRSSDSAVACLGMPARVDVAVFGRKVVSNFWFTAIT